ncbi:MAG: zinc metallopeptidase [Clostridia bacterium]|nr:zinc metallopeptidase [Clostridia bacterium]
MYFEYYLMGIILLPGIIIASIAQIKVSSAYNKYSQYFISSNITAGEFIKRLLNAADMHNTTVSCGGGHLSDHFNPKTDEIRLSNEVYNSSSVASLGVACHEFGHALQKKEKYAPYQIRRILIPITNFTSQLLWPLVIIGLAFNLAADTSTVIGNVFMWSGIIVFGLSVLVNLATLPVEFDASRRAVKILQTTGTMTEEELAGTKKVLNAAAFTYVAALLVSILNFLRFFLTIALNRRRD